MINFTRVSPIARAMFRLGAISGASAVALGAYGAHEVNGRVTDHSWEVFQKANKYQFMSSTMMCFSAVASPHPIISSSLFLATIVFFCVPLYASSINDTRYEANRLAPIGGFAAIAGWLSLAF